MAQLSRLVLLFSDFVTLWGSSASPVASRDPETATPLGFPLSRFGLFRVRSPLLTESLLLSFPRVTEMFQFTRFPLAPLCVQGGVPVNDDWWVSPFGYPRITGR